MSRWEWYVCKTLSCLQACAHTDMSLLANHSGPCSLMTRTSPFGHPEEGRSVEHPARAMGSSLHKIEVSMVESFINGYPSCLRLFRTYIFQNKRHSQFDNVRANLKHDSTIVPFKKSGLPEDLPPFAWCLTPGSRMAMNTIEGTKPLFHLFPIFFDIDNGQ